MHIKRSVIFKLFLILAIKIALLASAQVSDNEVCPTLIPEDPPVDLVVRAQRENDSDSRIINRSFVSEELRPYMAYISTRHENGRYTNCTAIFVSSRWLITAAQCDTNEKTTVRIGYPKLEDNNQDSIGIDLKENHPNFDRTNFYYDIAAVRLKDKAPEGTKSMKVNVDSSVPKESNPARIVGYGTSSAGGGNSEPAHARGFLRQVDVLISTAQ